MIWHAILHWLGLDSASGPAYLGWSGFGSDLSELALLAGIGGLLRKHNCEVHGCWRIGRHVTAAGHHVCRHHHPDPAVREGLRAHHILRAHQEHLARQSKEAP